VPWAPGADLNSLFDEADVFASLADSQSESRPPELCSDIRCDRDADAVAAAALVARIRSAGAITPVGMPACTQCPCTPTNLDQERQLIIVTPPD
jgi:hypothetical protein